MNARELHEKRAQLQAQAAQIMAVVDTEKRTLTSEEGAKFDAIAKEIGEIDGTLQRMAAAEEMEKRRVQSPGGQTPEARELNKRFSLAKMVLAAADPSLLIGFEKEMHEEAINEVRQFGQKIIGVGIPYKALAARREARAGEILAGATANGTGAGLIQYGETSIIEQLQSRFLGVEMGATMMTGLNGRIPIGRGKSFAAGWRDENGNWTGNSGAFDSIMLYPHALMARAKVSKELLLQGESAEGYLQNELIAAINAMLMNAMIQGTGANGQPTGILATSGIGDVAGGTNGLAPTWANVVALEGKVPADTGLQSLAYLTSSKAAAKMKTVARVSGTDSRMIMEGTEINGFKTFKSQQSPDNLVKGTSGAVCSSLIFGDFSQIMIGQWGGFDILNDHITSKNAGLLEIDITGFFDVLVKQPAAFAAIKDMLTA